jgi:2,4-dienoyl-CoA reductase-like NADH-dependent reductase (Old Yellow Enzyme family)
MPHLFEPLALRGVTLRNRIGVSPMCQYSAEDGAMNDWHLVHLGARAAGGAGVVIAEATAVEPRGRITPGDLGLWDDAQVAPLARVARFVKGQGAAMGVQLAHAGRKAGTARPWEGGASLPDDRGGWPIVGPSAIPFGEGDRVPRAMTAAEIAAVHAAFGAAAARADAAGVDLVELHAAHGYLGHSFCSPLSNRRDDAWGGPLENRVRFTVEALRAVRRSWPDAKPVAVRVSCTDWTDGGWTLDDTVALAALLKAEGADLVDCSAGGNTPRAQIPVGPAFMVPFAEAVRARAGVMTAAVGVLTEPAQADAIVREGRADLVLLGREMLRDPSWPCRAAKALGVDPSGAVPNQYLRAYPDARPR